MSGGATSEEAETTKRSPEDRLEWDSWHNFLLNTINMKLFDTSKIIKKRLNGNICTRFIPDPYIFTY